MAAVAPPGGTLAASDVAGLTRDLVDIDSTTGREHEVATWLAAFLHDRGYRVSEQPIGDGRFNVFAQLEAPPRVVFSTHFDCVPPFVRSRQEGGVIFGRGSCDAKGILASQVVAVERLRAAGESRVALQLAVLAVNRDKVAWLDQVDDEFQLFLAGVTADVNRRRRPILVNDVRLPPIKVIHHSVDSFLISGNDA